MTLMATELTIRILIQFIMVVGAYSTVLAFRRVVEVECKNLKVRRERKK